MCGGLLQNAPTSQAARGSRDPIVAASCAAADEAPQYYYHEPVQLKQLAHQLKQHEKQLSERRSMCVRTTERLCRFECRVDQLQTQVVELTARLDERERTLSKEGRKIRNKPLSQPVADQTSQSLPQPGSQFQCTGCVQLTAQHEQLTELIHALSGQIAQLIEQQPSRLVSSELIGDSGATQG